MMTKRIRVALLLTLVALVGCELCEYLPEPQTPTAAELCCAAVCGDGTCAAIDANGAADCSP